MQGCVYKNSFSFIFCVEKRQLQGLFAVISCHKFYGTPDVLYVDSVASLLIFAIK